MTPNLLDLHDRKVLERRHVQVGLKVEVEGRPHVWIVDRIDDYTGQMILTTGKAQWDELRNQPAPSPLYLLVQFEPVIS